MRACKPGCCQQRPASSAATDRSPPPPFPNKESATWSPELTTRLARAREADKDGQREPFFADPSATRRRRPPPGRSMRSFEPDAVANLARRRDPADGSGRRPPLLKRNGRPAAGAGRAVPGIGRAALACQRIKNFVFRFEIG